MAGISFPPPSTHTQSPGFGLRFQGPPPPPPTSPPPLFADRQGGRGCRGWCQHSYFVGRLVSCRKAQFVLKASNPRLTVSWGPTSPSAGLEIVFPRHPPHLSPLSADRQGGRGRHGWRQHSSRRRHSRTLYTPIPLGRVFDTPARCRDAIR